MELFHRKLYQPSHSAVTDHWLNKTPRGPDGAASIEPSWHGLFSKCLQVRRNPCNRITKFYKQSETNEQDNVKTSESIKVFMSPTMHTAERSRQGNFTGDTLNVVRGLVHHLLTPTATALLQLLDVLYISFGIVSFQLLRICWWFNTLLWTGKFTKPQCFSGTLQASKRLSRTFVSLSDSFVLPIL